MWFISEVSQLSQLMGYQNLIVTEFEIFYSSSELELESSSEEVPLVSAIDGGGNGGDAAGGKVSFSRW